MLNQNNVHAAIVLIVCFFPTPIRPTVFMVSSKCAIHQSNHLADTHRVNCHVSCLSPRRQLLGGQRGHHGRLEGKVPEYI